MIGYCAEELLARPFVEFIPPDLKCLFMSDYTADSPSMQGENFSSLLMRVQKIMSHAVPKNLKLHKKTNILEN